MRHSSFCRRYHSGRRGTPRLLRCEPLEHRWLLSITVDTLIDEADGSIGDGDISLRDAIAAADSGETIDFDASLDGGTILLTLGELSITQAMTLEATALENGLTIDASGNDPTPGENNGDGSRVFNINDNDDGTSSPVTISGLTLTGGDANERGGAIRTREVLAVINSTISGNSARDDGGGICASGDVTVTSSTISRNDAAYGSDGGGGIRASGDVTVTSSTISRNYSGWEWGQNGGGISASGDVTVTCSTISGNSALSGGGILAGDNVTVTSSTISDNSADRDGGGISGHRVTVTSSTISDNSARFGGGINVHSGTVTVTSSTISGNSADWSGGGIYARNGPVIIKNSMVASNTAGGTASDLRPDTGTLTVEYSLIGANTGTGLLEAPIGTPDANGNLIGGPAGGVIDPVLGALGDNGGLTFTHALPPGSPAIDAGDPDFAPPPEFDQRGNPRVADGNADGVPRIDMGSFEVLRGDVNGDGEVNGLDVDPFVGVLLNGPPSATADMNADGSVNGLDVDPFLAEVVGGAVPVGALDSASSLNILDVGSTVRQLHRRRPIHDSSHADDPAHLIHRRTMQHEAIRRSRMRDSVRDAGQRSPPRDIIYDVQHEAPGRWHIHVDLAMRDDTNWDRRR